MVEKVDIGISLEELLLRLEQDKRIEIVDGVFKESDPITAGFLHLHIIMNIFRLLDSYVQEKDIGFLGTDGLTCILNVNDDGIRTTRIPDAVYIHNDQIPQDWDMSKPFPHAPTLAVEVVSPTESSADIEKTLNDYLAYGTREVWVVCPDSKRVYQYKDAKHVTIHDAEDTLTSELFPELTLTVADFFKIKTFKK